MYGSRCYQVKTVSLCIQSVSRSATAAPLISCFCVRYQHDSTGEKMLVTCWYLTSPNTPPPFLGVCVSHPLLPKRAYHHCFQVSIKGHVPHFTAYMPYLNAKCCLICVLILTFIKNPALRFNGRGLVYQRKAICSSFSFF